MIRWTVTGIGYTLFLFAAAINAYYFICQHRDKNGSGPSYVPILGGLIGAGALLLMPIGSIGERAIWLWIPLIADIGCAFYVASGIWCMVFRRRQR